MKLSEIAKKLKTNSSYLSTLCRQGKFKTAYRVFENHSNCWHVEDKEAEEYMRNFRDKRYNAQ